MFPSLLRGVPFDLDYYSAHGEYFDREIFEGPERGFYHAFNSKLFEDVRPIGMGPKMFFVPELVVESMRQGQDYGPRERICSTPGRPGDVAFPIVLDVPLSETNGTIELALKLKRN